MPARNAFIAVLAMLLASCGFHLRQTMQLPEAMRTIFVDNASPQLQGEIATLLRFSNAVITPTRENAGIVIKVSGEQYRRISLSISNTGKTNEYELYYSVDFEISDAAGKVLLPKKNMIVTRSYFYDQTLILSAGYQEITLQQEMYRYAAREMVERGRFALINAGK